MKALRLIAKLARMGDLEGIQKLLNEEQYVNTAVREGFYDADREMGRDRLPAPSNDPLEEIADIQRERGTMTGVRPPAPKQARAA